MRTKQEYSPQIVPRAPFLALVGDIGLPRDSRLGLEDWMPQMEEGIQDQRLRDLGVQKGEYSEQYWCFLKQMSSLFQHVFVTTGNHEYYGAVLQEVDALLAQMAEALGNVTFLNMTKFCLELKNEVYYVVGGCLWSYVPESARFQVGFQMNDYRHISLIENQEGEKKTRTLTVEDTIHIHEEQVKWLSQQIEFVKEEQEKEKNKPLNEQRKVKLIVLTHHAPLTQSSDPQFEGQPMNTAFCTDLSSMMDGNYISLWAFGHTHFSTQRLVNGTIVVSNQMGYPFEDHYETRHEDNLRVQFPENPTEQQKNEWIEFDQRPLSSSLKNKKQVTNPPEKEEDSASKCFLL